MFLKSPIRVKCPMFDMDQRNVKKSIDHFLDLLISSPKYCCIADDEFGFALEDFHYESFSVDKAKFFETKDNPHGQKETNIMTSIRNPLYAKKIIGNSKNEDTFARELKRSIERYEKRLKDVSVTMDFQEHGKMIRILVDAKLNDGTNTSYSYEFKMIVW